VSVPEDSVPEDSVPEDSVPGDSVPGDNGLVPPGLSAGEFQAALRALAAALGDDAVLQDEGGVAEFRDPGSS
jgi:hypothetical protein